MGAVKKEAIKEEDKSNNNNKKKKNSNAAETSECCYAPHQLLLLDTLCLCCLKHFSVDMPERKELRVRKKKKRTR